MFCLVFSKSYPESATCFRLSLGTLVWPRLQGQEGGAQGTWQTDEGGARPGPRGQISAPLGKTKPSELLSQPLLPWCSLLGLLICV